MSLVIVEKLSKHLSHPIQTEADALYLLAQVRKLIEQDKRDPRPFALVMYCHWALHINLTKGHSTSYFLETVDAYLCNEVFGLTAYREVKFIESHHLFRDFVYLDTFRRQLGETLSGYGLPIELCVDDEKWFNFLSVYAHIIEEGQLSAEITTKKGPFLHAVERVTFSIGPAPRFPESHLPFTIRWDVALKDGRTCRFDMQASKDSRAISHCLTVLPPRQEGNASSA